MRLVTLATFATPEEAQLARNLLEADDIRSQLGDAATVGMQWTLGNALGWVKLLVLEEDLERAQRVLDERQALPDDDDDDADPIDDDSIEGDSPEHERESGNHADPRPTPEVIDGWLCPACNAEVDQDDRKCWSCGSERHGWQNPYHASQAKQHGSANNPANRSDSSEQLATSDGTTTSELVARAWRAAIIGIVCFPPLGNLYSLFLLLTVTEPVAQLPPRVSRKYWMALAIDLIVIGVMTLGLWAWTRWNFAGGQLD